MKPEGSNQSVLTQTMVFWNVSGLFIFYERWNRKNYCQYCSDQQSFLMGRWLYLMILHG